MASEGRNGKEFLTEVRNAWSSFIFLNSNLWILSKISGGVFNGLLHQKKGNGNSKEQREISLGIDRLIETVGTHCDYLLT